MSKLPTTTLVRVGASAIVTAAVAKLSAFGRWVCGFPGIEDPLCAKGAFFAVGLCFAGALTLLGVLAGFLLVWWVRWIADGYEDDRREIIRERARLERLQSEIITGDAGGLSQVYDAEGRLSPTAATRAAGRKVRKGLRSTGSGR